MSEPMTLLKVRGIEKTSPSFRAKLVTVAEELGINPDWLATVMAFESMGTFSASVQNPFTKATGLIQFMPATAKRLGTTIDALKAMTSEAQLDYVKAYFEPMKGRLKSLEDTYLMVFFPKFIGQPSSTVVFKAGDIGYKQNAGFDPRKTGVITVGAITSTIRGIRDAARGARIVVDMALGVATRHPFPTVAIVGGLVAGAGIIAVLASRKK
jgi:hypothetical protein